LEKGLPKVKARLILSAWEKSKQWSEELVAQFQARILKAVHDRDLAFLKNLIKAMELPIQPAEPMNGIRAAIDAFDDLFLAEGLEHKEDWPSKQEVRRRAEEIMKEAGYPIPSDRQWPRIYPKAGLWQLLSVKHGPARRRKKADT
jgi:hypothetical protein